MLNVLDMSGALFLFELTSTNEVRRILETKDWMFEGLPVFLRQWSFASAVCGSSLFRCVRRLDRCEEDSIVGTGVAVVSASERGRRGEKRGTRASNARWGTSVSGWNGMATRCTSASALPKKDRYFKFQTLGMEWTTHGDGSYSNQMWWKGKFTRGSRKPGGRNERAQRNGPRGGGAHCLNRSNGDTNAGTLGNMGHAQSEQHYSGPSERRGVQAGDRDKAQAHREGQEREVRIGKEILAEEGHEARRKASEARQDVDGEGLELTPPSEDNGWTNDRSEFLKSDQSNLSDERKFLQHLEDSFYRKIASTDGIRGAECSFVAGEELHHSVEEPATRGNLQASEEVQSHISRTWNGVVLSSSKGLRDDVQAVSSTQLM
ncbi:hypothetical protein F0562_029688 [Nyssa sinensis]|uniref:DUF4283 domain-containing protein n=1 Tax=Nyssa sinensis TaxID=561372 RepID=A0A5J5B7P5_9ASTE|nr:hypothetical protein F0562_029688 [Nyssa sinensis]